MNGKATLTGSLIGCMEVFKQVTYLLLLTAFVSKPRVAGPPPTITMSAVTLLSSRAPPAVPDEFFAAINCVALRKRSLTHDSWLDQKFNPLPNEKVFA